MLMMRAASSAPAPEPPSAVGTVSASNPPRTAGRNSRTESSPHDHAARPSRQIRTQAGLHGRRWSELRPWEVLCEWNCPARSPCYVQSEEPQNVPAQFRQYGIAPVPRIGTIDRDVGLDARGPIAEHDHAIGQKHGLLHIMGHQ